MGSLLDSYPWILPLVIFLGRLCEVPLSTIRIMFVARGERKLAPIIGFFEVFIWIVVVSQVISRADSLISYLTYAGGFAAGTYFGIVIEDQLALGFYKYRIYMKGSGLELMKLLKEHNFGATIFHGQGARVSVNVVEAIISRKNKDKVERIIRNFEPEAFVVVQEIKDKSFGIFSVRKRFTRNRAENHA